MNPQQWSNVGYHMLSDVEIHLLETLRKHKSLSRAELVRLTQLPRTTIYDNISRLRLYGYVYKQFKNNGKGRPITMFTIREELKN